MLSCKIIWEYKLKVIIWMFRTNITKKMKRLLIIIVMFVQLIVVSYSQISDTSMFISSDSVQSNELPESVRLFIERFMEDEQANTNAAQTEEQMVSESFDLDGLVIDETISKVGHDFYTLFYENWKAPEKITDYIINISELPSPGMGSVIIIKINDEIIFNNRISPKQDLIESLAGMAIQISSNYLVNYQEMKSELEGGDMSGSGIF